MQDFTITKQDGNVISCVREIPDHFDGIVIAVHGFTSSKESSTYRRILSRMPEAGFGAICLDLPGHGTSESLKESLRIPGALDSIEAVERYAMEMYPGSDIFYFGSSFGAYLIGLYISTREHTGRKAFWRSAAVNMPKLFHTETPSETELQQLEELRTQGYFDVTMEQHRSVRITQAMYDDLLQNDLFERFDPDRFGKHRIDMAHGTEDAVISPDAARRFAERFGIPVTWFEGDGHSLSGDPSTPDKVIDLAISLYRGES